MGVCCGLVGAVCCALDGCDPVPLRRCRYQFQIMFEVRRRSARPACRRCCRPSRIASLCACKGPASALPSCRLRLLQGSNCAVRLRWVVVVVADVVAVVLLSCPRADPHLHLRQRQAAPRPVLLLGQGLERRALVNSGRCGVVRGHTGGWVLCGSAHTAVLWSAREGGRIDCGLWRSD
jgi:hypothetical protein